MTSPLSSLFRAGRLTLQSLGTSVTLNSVARAQRTFHRFILSYKSLPFDTVWVELPDIASTLDQIGASPNQGPDGRELYTVPVLSDPNTGAIVTDSWMIAEYLDETYPEKRIFPPGTRGLISAFNAAVLALGGNSFRFGLLRTSEILNERSREYFIRTREAALGMKVDEWSVEGPERDAHWTSAERVYGLAKTWYEEVEGEWLMGNTFSYADIILAARTLWFKRVFRDDEWNRIASLHDGRWEKLLADVEKECNLA